MRDALRCRRDAEGSGEDRMPPPPSGADQAEAQDHQGPGRGFGHRADRENGRGDLTGSAIQGSPVHDDRRAAAGAVEVDLVIGAGGQREQPAVQVDVWRCEVEHLVELVVAARRELRRAGHRIRDQADGDAVEGAVEGQDVVTVVTHQDVAGGEGPVAGMGAAVGEIPGPARGRGRGAEAKGRGDGSSHEGRIQMLAHVSLQTEKICSPSNAQSPEAEEYKRSHLSTTTDNTCQSSAP